MELLATCRVCATPEPVIGFERRIGKCVERWCKGCHKTTLQFIGEDWAEQNARNANPPRKTFATGR